MNIILLIQNIPKGKVLTYGKIAKLAGDPRAARQVSWILNSSTEKYNFPWHRVINSKGLIALRSEEGKLLQKQLLEQEGISFLDDFKIDLTKHMWKIETVENLKIEEVG
jgi:methylated-DNA-protein-cysteine methyltransferase-like protein